MKAILIRFRVASLRSFVDSGWIKTNDLVCLVGTNALELGSWIAVRSIVFAEAWCAQAAEDSVAHGGKAWRYRVLAGDGIRETVGLVG